MSTVAVSDDSFRPMLQSSQPVLVDFWAEWCGRATIAPALEIAGEMDGQVTVAKLNIDDNPKCRSSMVCGHPHVDAVQGWRGGGHQDRRPAEGPVERLGRIGFVTLWQTQRRRPSGRRFFARGCSRPARGRPDRASRRSGCAPVDGRPRCAPPPARPRRLRRRCRRRRNARRYRPPQGVFLVGIVTVRTPNPTRQGGEKILCYGCSNCRRPAWGGLARRPPRLDLRRQAAAPPALWPPSARFPHPSAGARPAAHSQFVTGRASAPSPGRGHGDGPRQRPVRPARR